MEENLTTISLYLKEINKTPAPTAEENKELLRRYKNGDQEAYKQLIDRNLRLVIPYAKSYAKRNDVELLDVIQNGNLGLISAIEKFDISFNVSFSTYAVPWIKQSIDRKNIDTEKNIRVPASVVTNNRRIATFIKEYEMKNGQSPTDEEIKVSLKLSDYYIKQYRESINYKNLSLDETINDEEDSFRYEFVKSNDNNYRFFEEEVDKRILLYKLKAVLTDQEYYVIYFRYFTETKSTIHDLAKELHCAKQNVEQVENRALEKIKRVFKAKNKKQISINEVMKADLIPLSFSNYILLYLLKDSLTEEEYYVYYQKEILNRKVKFFFPEEVERLYLKAKSKESELLRLSITERAEIALKNNFRNNIFKIEPTYIENGYDEVFNYFASMTYTEFMDRYQDELGPLNYQQLNLLKKFFHHSKTDINIGDYKEALKEINLKVLKYRRNIFLPKEILYETYMRNKYLFSSKEQEVIESQLFNLRSSNEESVLTNYQYIEKIEKIYFGIYERQGIYFKKEEVEKLLVKHRSNFSDEEIEILHKEYGIGTYKHKRGELEKELGITQSQLMGKIRNLWRRMFKLKYSINLENAINKDIYMPFLLNDLYGIKEENRLLTISYLEGMSYALLSSKTGISQNKVCNAIQDVIRNIDFYRFGIVSKITYKDEIVEDVLKVNDYESDEMKIIKKYYQEKEIIDKIAFDLSISIQEVEKVINRFKKEYEKYLINSVSINESDYNKEIICHITDSILDERERYILSYKYGIKCEYNKDGIKLTLPQIIEKFSITENIYYHINKGTKLKIKKRKAGILSPLLGHINKAELERLVNDEHVPLTPQERELLNRLKGMNNYSFDNIETLMNDYNLTRNSVLRKYQRAILTIYKYQNNEKNGQISYNQDVLPYLKYFSLFEVKIIKLFYEQSNKPEQIAEKLGLTKDSAFYEIEQINRKLVSIRENEPNTSKFDYEYARTVLTKSDLPLHLRTDMAITCYELYTGESGHKKQNLPEIIETLNMDVSKTSLERIIDQVKLSVCKYKFGFRKEFSFKKEEIELFYQNYYEQLSKEEKIKFDRYLSNNSRRIMQYRNYWADNINYIMLEKTGNLPFDLAKMKPSEIELLLNNKKLVLSRKTKDILLSILGKSEKDMMSGKDKLKVFRILRPIYIMTLEQHKIYQKASFYLHKK